MRSRRSGRTASPTHPPNSNNTRAVFSASTSTSRERDAPLSVVHVTFRLPAATVIATVLENLERPALLVRGQNVVFANRPGMRCLAAVRAWAANRERAPRPGVVTPIAPGGFQLDLVIAHTPTSKHLPPSLRPIVELLAQGLSDKEIATSLNMPLTTVRTYVSRALRKLGIHDRREIIRFMAEKNGTA